MRRIYLLAMLIAFSYNANAQFKIGIVIKEFTLKADKKVDKKRKEKYDKGYDVLYKENAEQSTITIYSEDDVAALFYFGTYPSSDLEDKFVFSGVYLGYTTCPDGERLNIMKGPGTDYEIVDTLPGDWQIFFKTADSNWLEVVDREEDGITTKTIGYIYKDQVKDPETDIR